MSNPSQLSNISQTTRGQAVGRVEVSLDQRLNALLRDAGLGAGAARIADILSGIVFTATKTAGTIEKSLDSLLAYTNITTRSEHQAVEETVEALGRRVEVLARRIEKLQADVKGLKKASDKQAAISQRAAERAKKSATTKTTTRSGSSARSKTKAKSARR
jgi:vacuolar-type H+-ATPase subunit I/STV1